MKCLVFQSYFQQQQGEITLRAKRNGLCRLAKPISGKACKSRLNIKFHKAGKVFQKSLVSDPPHVNFM